MLPPNPGVDLQPLLRTEEGSSLAIYGSMRRFAEDGIRRDTTPLLRYPSSEVTPDTLSHWAGPEWSYARTAGGASRTYVGFARSLAAFGNTEWCVLGDTDVPIISQLDQTGSLVRLVESTYAGPVVTEAEGAQWRRLNARLLGESAPERLRQLFAEAPYNETYPTFDAVAVDTDGALWIGLTARLDDRERRWVIFGVTGDPVGRLDLPMDAEILDIRDDWLALLRTDDLDVEEITLYRVTRN
jgi:hypothetical protein